MLPQAFGIFSRFAVSEPNTWPLMKRRVILQSTLAGQIRSRWAQACASCDLNLGEPGFGLLAKVF
jgi:hypothetical protein